MIGLCRPLVLLVAVTSLTAAPALAQDVRQTFEQGTELLRRGRDDEALRKFQEVLAMDPGHDAAYELFLQTEHQVWLDILVKEGEFELVAKRLMGLAAVGRKARRNDPDAIRTLLAELSSDDVLLRVRTIHTLAAEHGEYAVRYMLPRLANQENDDRRVIFMNALTRMGGDVVLPLIEGLRTGDVFQQRNVALTLGYIADPRASGFLADLAANAEDEGVRAAAAEAVQRCGGSTNALGQLLELGLAYHNQDPTVLLPYQVSEVVWHWSGTGIEETEVPAFLYNEELAKMAFYAALSVSPGSTEALAGIARSSVVQQAELSEWAAAGQDVAEWQERLAEDDLAIQVAGSRALDLALSWALEQDDQVAASGLCRALARSAAAPTQGLQAALARTGQGAIRGEAAVALGWIAYHGGQGASGDVVAALSEASGRLVLQIAGVIDGDDVRRTNLVSALENKGLMVNAWSSGAKGLAGLRAIPGIDVLLVAESLPDLTFAQIVDEVRRDPRTENTPILILAADGQAALDLWGDRVVDAISAPSEIVKVEEALTGNLGRDRQQADDLAARAAGTLQHLAAAGHTDMGSAPAVLAATLAGRPDAVTIPAMAVLGHAGGRGEVDALVAVLGDGGRSDEARIAAGNALAGVFARHPSGASESTLVALEDVLTSDAALPIRQATSTALGSIDLDPVLRARLVEKVRANIAGE
ncbi:MAG: HEAT repeat domain-containing protein [Planctomycetota bacterium]|nr:HEAT repeat domain-containing protein [Planctomycetota bacterium]